MAEAWTKGPWLIAGETFIYALNAERYRVNRFTASVDGGFDDDHQRTSKGELSANAHLISAAPELYEALKDWVSLHGSANAAELVKAFGDEEAECILAARAALAKARGETP